MTPPDKGLEESVMGNAAVGRCGIRSCLCVVEAHEGWVPSPFRVDQTFLTALRIDD